MSTRPKAKSGLFGTRLRVREDLERKVRPAERGLRLSLVQPRYEGAGVRQPVLVIEPGVEIARKKAKPLIVRRLKVFTATTKMRCGSFSLPAGPPAMGGTCPAAGTKPASVPASEWVCAGCYATTGNYVFASVQLIQGLRKEWVRRAVADGSFEEQLAWALAAYFATPRTAAVPLPGQKKSARVALDRRYFRVHDSGDFAWQPPAYMRAWFAAARRFPDVHFWAPTRDWVFDKWRALLAEAPANFAVRPSALRVGEAAPVVPGLAAGTSVAFGAARGTWDCPAYAADEHSCATGINPQGGKGCRVCWDQPERRVNYSPHGTIEKPQLVQLRVRKNPVPWREPLADLARAFAQGRGGGDPRRPSETHAEFPAWLAARGLPPSSFAEGEWLDLLTDAGLAVDDAAEYLADAAEWG